MAKQRNLSDDEIGIVKAMLRKGWRNDVIHYYFNKPDRLISSGRITQIKNGKYGASVEEAQPEELEAFLAAWQDPKAKAPCAYFVPCSSAKPALGGWRAARRTASSARRASGFSRRMLQPERRVASRVPTIAARPFFFSAGPISLRHRSGICVGGACLPLLSPPRPPWRAPRSGRATPPTRPRKDARCRRRNSGHCRFG